ncbi:hypothetical protein WAI453_003227 [Rhynchosporium graminicola]
MDTKEYWNEDEDQLDMRPEIQILKGDGKMTLERYPIWLLTGGHAALQAHSQTPIPEPTDSYLCYTGLKWDTDIENATVRMPNGIIKIVPTGVRLEDDVLASLYLDIPMSLKDLAKLYPADINESWMLEGGLRSMGTGMRFHQGAGC